MEHARRSSRDWGLIAILSFAGLMALLIVVGLIRGVAGQGEYESQQRAESCESDYSYLLQNESYGHSAQNSHLWDAFRTDCDEQLEALNAYVDARATVRAASNDCVGLETRIDAELLGMLESYGECDGVPLADRYEVSESAVTEPTSPALAPADDAQPAWPGGAAVGWDEAAAHAGTTQRVCGPLMSMRTTGDGTFVNIGTDYPSPDRFTFIFWDLTLDPIESGSVLCGRGDIYLYEGLVAQIEMQDPGALEIWR